MIARVRLSGFFSIDIQDNKFVSDRPLHERRVCRVQKLELEILHLFESLEIRIADKDFVNTLKQS